MNSSCRIITKPKNFQYGPGVEMILSQGVGQWLSDLPPIGIRPLVVDEYPIGFNTKDLSVYLPQTLNNLTGSSSSNVVAVAVVVAAVLAKVVTVTMGEVVVLAEVMTVAVAEVVAVTVVVYMAVMAVVVVLTTTTSINSPHHYIVKVSNKW